MVPTLMTRLLVEDTSATVADAPLEPQASCPTQALIQFLTRFDR